MFKIRTKLMAAFLAMLLPFIVLIGINSYNERAISLVVHKVEDEQHEISRLSDIQIVIEGLIMPPNDYLITGNIREREGFLRIATELEGYLLNLSDTMSCRQCHDDTHEKVKRLYGLKPKSSWPEEMVYMKEIMDSLQIIKEKGEKIFKIEKPVGSKEGAILMQEIDITAHKLIIENLAKHKKEDNQEVLMAEIDSARVWRRSRFMMAGGFALFVALGLFFAFFYARFFVRPIKKLHNGADAIARGDFKARLDVKTGDELEQLANAMNEMAAQLDSLYSNLEQKVEERTGELRESETKFKTLSEQSPSMIFINRRGRVVYANAKCEEVMKYKREEFYSPDFDFLSLIAPESADLIRSKFDKHQRGEEVEPYEYTIVSKDGRRLEVMQNSILIDFEGEKAILGILTEITDRKLAETKLKKTYQELKQSQAASLNIMADLNREVEERKKAEAEREKLLSETRRINKELQDFAYIVSHDLKAPLRAIGTISSWIAEDYKDKLDDAGKEQLNILLQRTKRMHDMIEGILTYSRVGRIKGTPGTIDTGKVAEQVREALSPPANIRINIHGPMPTITIDPVQINQVIQNLISNAIKYMDKPEGLIEVGCKDAGDFWEFYVKDNGPGIEERHFERIFQIFQTLKARDEFESTGIGLTIVKKIIEQNVGRIWVESEVGKGSTFKFTLPKG